MKDYELTFLPKVGYLNAVVTGQNRAENVAAYLRELQLEVSSSGCPYVLVEETLGAIRALAYIDLNATDDTMEFAELVATNRSMPVRVFSSVAKGEHWLRGEVERDQI